MLYQDSLENDWSANAPDQGQQPRRKVVMLHEHIHEWIRRADKDDALRFVLGGPGCGKSSFVKMLAAELADNAGNEGFDILYIPLHLFTFNGDIITSLNHYIETSPRIKHNPLPWNGGGNARLCILFDGLDELENFAGNARTFLEQAEQMLRRCNTDRIALQVLITGRELALSELKSRYRNGEHCLIMLPYFIKMDEREIYRGDEGKQQLLDEDQREAWWIKYGKKNGGNYAGLPGDLRITALEDLTPQPLLNYLVALVRESGFEFNADTNLNSIYARLIQSVHERIWEQRRQLPGVDMFEPEEFNRILEEIAVAAWHGGEVRATTLQAIEQRCLNEGLQDCLEKFKRSCSSGLIRLLAAFFFRESDTGIATGGRFFEFTHKTFGEYLAARRIVKELRLLYAKEQGDPEWTTTDSLIRWAKRCGPARMDNSILNFLRNEVRLENNEERVRQWQTTLENWFNAIFRFGMPMHECALDSFQKECDQSRNAEEALLATLNACALVTNKISTIYFPAKTSFGAWLHKIRSQRVITLPTGVVLQCLSFLDLQGQTLSRQDIAGANLTRTNLTGTSLCKTDLTGACLCNTDLTGADLNRADLREANITGADLTKANLSGAVLTSTRFNEACLKQANLYAANLYAANLYAANLSEANFREADLSRAKLEAANLTKANLTKANLKNAIMPDGSIHS